MEDKINILILHPQTVVYRVLREIISSDFRYNILEECHSGTQAVKVFERERVDIFLSTDRVVDMCILDVLKQAQMINPQMKTILYLMSKEVKILNFQVMRVGCCGFIPPDASPEDMLNGIEKVVEGKDFIDECYTQPLNISIISENMSNEHRKRSLSPQEEEVLYYIVTGHRLVEIAEKMNIDPKTVSTYKNRICHKIDVTSTFELLSKFYSLL